MSATTCQRSPSPWSISSLSQTCVPSKDGISQPTGEPSWLICLPVVEFFGLTFRLWAAMITTGAFGCQPVISSDIPFWHRDLWTRILAPSQTLPKPDYPFQQQRHVGSSNYWLAVVMVHGCFPPDHRQQPFWIGFQHDRWHELMCFCFSFFFKADVEMRPWWPSLSIASAETTTKNTEHHKTKKQKQKNKESVSRLRDADTAVSLNISQECGGW